MDEPPLEDVLAGAHKKRGIFPSVLTVGWVISTPRAMEQPCLLLPGG